MIKIRDKILRKMKNKQSTTMLVLYEKFIERKQAEEFSKLLRKIC